MAIGHTSGCVCSVKVEASHSDPDKVILIPFRVSGSIIHGSNGTTSSSNTKIDGNEDTFHFNNDKDMRNTYFFDANGLFVGEVFNAGFHVAHLISL